ncbi:MAG: ABC transporter substrate-binding protein [Dehalococcoidia bacterium]
MRSLFTFKLQEGVKWQNLPPVNGCAFEAQDVKLTYERYQSTPTQRLLFEAVESITTPDKTTVTIKVKEPAVYFLYNLVGTSVHITAKEVWERDGDLRTTMVGTGPFMPMSTSPTITCSTAAIRLPG